jgi:hypothetical protein
VTDSEAVREARRALYWKIQGARSHMQMVRETEDAFATYDDAIRADEHKRYEALVTALEEIRDASAATPQSISVAARALAALKEEAQT